MNNKILNPYGKEAENVLEELGSTIQGLNKEEALRRLTLFGPNEIPKGPSVSIFYLILKQFKNWLVAILIIAAIISWLAGEIVDTWIIVMVVLINAAIGFYQELKAEKAIASLQKLMVKTAKVYRDGSLIIVPSNNLVPGDILVLEEGDNIPADARIIKSKNFRTTEASLTGESLPINKKTEKLIVPTPLADQKNMVWKSTFASGGFALCIVTGTGSNTIIGDISETLYNIKDKTQTNFMKKIDKLAQQMSIIAISSAVLIFITGYFFRGFKIDQILLTSIAALVAAVPEGLPAVISIVLAIGANRMAKKNAIIREFSATETLGAVTAILTDKTGTLTQNSLTVRKVFVPGKREFKITGEGWSPTGNFQQEELIVEPSKITNLQKLLKIVGISNNSEIRYSESNQGYELIGDPTEGALLSLSKKGGFNPKEFAKNKLDDLPFDSQLKLRATLIKELDHKEIFIIGAPERILERSEKVLTSDGESALSQNEKDDIHSKISEWSAHAMRVIAVAYKTEKANKIEEKNINELVFVGLAGMIDPPRPDAKEAVIKCKQAGIRVIMVTGDHINTAVAIAKATGILNIDKKDKIQALTEQQLIRLDNHEFDNAISNVSVFARLTPKMKLKIASRLQKMGHLIAMTGDGVNDAPALKQADVGVSMGIMGTDVARESSDIVLADDNFTTIVKAIEEGRIVFTNSRQTSFFLITTNIAESITLFITIALGLPIPLIATQILWLNLVTDSFPAIALANEKSNDTIINSTITNKHENILNKEVFPFLFINVLIMAGLSIGTFYYFLDDGLEKARNGVFIIMAFTQLFNVFNLRSIQQSVFKIGIFSNKYINLAVGISALLLIFVSEFPALASPIPFPTCRL